MFDVSWLKKELKTRRTGRSIHYFSEVGSTNEKAKELASQGTAEGTVVMAETQRCGRGRLGRRWLSPSGGVWLSIILRPKASPKETLKLTLTTAVAVAKTLHKMFGLDAEIKWPNDVLIEGKKVCGILVEASTRNDKLEYAIVGIGINANIDVTLFPEKLRATATTLKHLLGRKIDREELVCSLLETFESYYNLLESDGFSLILDDWRRLATFLGCRVEVSSFEEKFEGVAVDADENGWLIIRLDDGCLRKVVSGDVSVRRKS